MPLSILLVQAVFGPPVPADLRKPVPRMAVPACGPAAGGSDITVCARRGPDQRLKPLPDAAAEPVNPLSFRLPGGGSASANAEQSNVGGFTGIGAKLKLRIPFGRGKRD